MKKSLVEILLKNRPGFNTLVDFDAATEKMAHIDFTASNTELTEAVYSDIELFSAYIDNERKEHHAKFLIGGYNELREMYKRSTLFNFEKGNSKLKIDNAAISTEPRRLHLGVDIWGAAGTKVYAPLGGMVHSFANNNNYGDYGATIILQHQIDTVIFFTLYGHLSLSDITSLRKGQFITRGQCFAHFGSPVENGNWPPHLHFQVIEDIEMKEGDYPGVCKVSEANKYLKNCPDPDLILDITRHIKAEHLPLKIV